MALRSLLALAFLVLPTLLPAREAAAQPIVSGMQLEGLSGQAGARLTATPFPPFLPEPDRPAASDRAGGWTAEADASDRAAFEESFRNWLRKAADELKGGDPLEALNRRTDAFNDLVEAYVLDPFYRFYINTLPAAVRHGVSNVFRNLHEPITAISAALEGDLENAWVASLRFGVNSTVGVLGTMDVATRLDLVSRRTDLGASFCSYGVPGGPYLVLPILGPTSARDLTGRVLTNLTIYNFVGALFYPYYSGRLLAEYIDDRPGLVWAMEGAIDGYARKRALFRQYEADLCRGKWAGSDNQGPYGSDGFHGDSLHTVKVPVQ